MSVTGSHQGLQGLREHPLLSPAAAFAAAILLVVLVFALTSGTISPDLVMPVVATTLFALAGVSAVLAWQLGGAATRLTYWDVAGALTFIGIVLAALIDPEQMVRIAEGTERRP